MSKNFSKCVLPSAKHSLKQTHASKYLLRHVGTLAKDLVDVFEDVKASRNKGGSCLMASRNMYGIEKQVGELYAAATVAEKIGDEALRKKIVAKTNDIEEKATVLRKALYDQCMSSWELRGEKRSGVSGLKKRKPAKKKAKR
jgi:hypothetical protein